MKDLGILIKIMVLFALLGFIGCSVYIFYISFDILVEDNLPEDYLKQLNPARIYANSVLTGLVGGIVATSFGVKLPDDVPPQTNQKLQNLGSYIVRNQDSDKTKEKIGFFYALSYILIGFGAIIIWFVLGDQTMQNVSNMAMTFLGMLIPIVAQYFNN